MAKNKPTAGVKAKYRVLRPIAWIGERKEIGSVIEMTAEQAAGIGEEYLSEIDAKKVKESKKAKDEPTKPEDNAPAEGSEQSPEGEGTEIQI